MIGYLSGTLCVFCSFNIFSRADANCTHHINYTRKFNMKAAFEKNEKCLNK